MESREATRNREAGGKGVEYGERGRGLEGKGSKERERGIWGGSAANEVGSSEGFERRGKGGEGKGRSGEEMESERIDEASAREVECETWWSRGGGGEVAEVAKGHGLVQRGSAACLVYALGLSGAYLFVT